MATRWTIAALMLAAAPAWAGNFATCVLDKAPGVSNGATHAAVLQMCTKEHPSRYSSIKKGEGRGIFSFADGNACVIKRAASTTYQPAATVIASACRCLYDAPRQQGELCDGKIRFENGEVFDPSTARPER